MACYISCGKTEHKSEDRMFRYLQDHLPRQWVVLGNVALIERDRDLEVDAVIMGGGRIWALEGKCWRGSITGDQYTWSQNGNSRPSPLRSLGNKARKLSSAAKECGVGSFVTSLVVMLADRQDYSLDIQNDPSIERCVKHLHDVPGNLVAQSHPGNLPSEQLLAIVKRLGGTKAEDALTKYQSTAKRSESIPEATEKDDRFGYKGHEEERLFILTLRGKDSFIRTYYSCDVRRILLGRDELRGASPSVWETWVSQGMVVRFSRNGVGFEAIPGTSVILNGSVELPERKIVKPRGTTGQVNIGGIDLGFEIESIRFD